MLQLLSYTALSAYMYFGSLPKVTSSDKAGWERRVSTLSHGSNHFSWQFRLEEKLNSRIKLPFPGVSFLGGGWVRGRSSVLLLGDIEQRPVWSTRDVLLILRKGVGAHIPLFWISLALVPLCPFLPSNIWGFKRGQAGTASPDKEHLCKATGYSPS